MGDSPWEYFVGKETLQVQTGHDENGRAVVEYRNPGAPLPEAAGWDNALERYIDLGLVVRVRRLSDDELLDEARRRGLLDKTDAPRKPRRRRGRRGKKAAEKGQPQQPGENGGEQATGEGGADAAPPATDSPGEFPKHAGGGMYELSNGERVRGKAKAAAAQADLQGA